MKVLHFGTLDVNAGGPAMSTYYTLTGLKKIGIDVDLVSFPLTQNGKLVGKELSPHYVHSPIDNKLLYSFSLKSEIFSLGNFDIYHAQGVWQYPTYAMASIARKRHKPYLITPRGMLYPQDIAKASTSFKKLSLKFKLLKDLNEAACVHVTCEEEMKHCRDLGVISPIAIIPNCIEWKSDYPAKEDTIFRLGYLGRLSPRKNVEGLLYAWKALGAATKNAELLIIGGGDSNYENFLKAEVDRLGLLNVRFTGFVSGKEKDRYIASLSVLAMPSEFENFGNVILEGLIRGIPCIATKGAPWRDLVDYECGWWVDFTPESLRLAVEDAFSKGENEINAMGKRGMQLVIDKYQVSAVAHQMKTLYQWILTKENKPEFVFYIQN